MPESDFSALDWAVLAAYAALLAFTGWAFSRRAQAGTDDYFLAGRRVPTWVAAISVLATATSAATFIGAPAQSYAGNLTYMATNIGMILAAITLALWFIPAYYRAGVTSIYEMIGRRYGPSAQRAASVTYMLGRVMASGARIYIGAIPAALIVFGSDDAAHVAIAIAAMTTVGVVYTLIGGIGAVVWTDVVQAIIILAAVLTVAILLLARLTEHGGPVLDILAASRLPDGSSKLTILDLSLAPDSTYTLWTACTAFVLMGLASYGVDQDLTQRMLTCKSPARASWSVVSALLLNLPVIALFMVVGLLLYVFYGHGEQVGVSPRQAPPRESTVFLHYILTELPAGLRGLMMAGLCAAALSSINSTLNAMSSTLITDLYRPLRPGKPELHYLRAGRAGVLLWGVVLGSFACVCILWQRGDGSTLIDFALGVMTFAYAGLLAVFVSAVLTRRGSAASAIAAMIVGAAVVVALQPGPWSIWATRLGIDAPPIAFPWRLTLGAIAAFAACQLGMPSARRSPRPTAHGRTPA